MKRTRLKQVSSKQAAINRERHKIKLEIMEERGPWCEARIMTCCDNYGCDLHEIVKRGCGGSATDKNNIILICRSCHAFIENNPAKAKELGLYKSYKIT